MSSSPSKLAPADVQQLLTEHRRTQDHKCRDAIVTAHLDLVSQITRKFACETPDLREDLAQVGCIGLLRAIERYDPVHNVEFATYASRLITGEILHYLRDKAPLIRPPRDLQEMASEVRAAEQRLRLELGQDPTDEEVAISMGVEVEKIRDVHALADTRHILSLDASANEEEPDISIGDRIEDKRYRSFVLAEEDRIIVAEAMTKLRGQSRQVIEFAFYQDLTQTEIAQHLKISQMQVSRRLKTAMHELWRVLNTRVTPW